MLYIDAIVFTIAALLIALVKPYKKAYTNVVDSFLLAYLALLSSMVSTVAGAVVLLKILFLFPAAVFTVLVLMRITNRWYKSQFNGNILKENVDTYCCHISSYMRKRTNQTSNCGSTNNQKLLQPGETKYDYESLNS